MVRFATVADYSATPAARDVDLASEREERFLQEFAALAGSEGQTRLGVYIAHSHVQLKLGEVLINSRIAPEKRSCRPGKLTDDLIANHFRFSSNGLIAEEFSAGSGVDPLTVEEKLFAEEKVWPLLVEHGLQDRLGIFFLDESPDVESVWFESVIPETRTMEITRVPRTELPEVGRYATHFRVDVEEKSLATMATMACKPMCDR